MSNVDDPDVDTFADDGAIVSGQQPEEAPAAASLGGGEDAFASSPHGLALAAAMEGLDREKISQEISEATRQQAEVRKKAEARAEAIAQAGAAAAAALAASASISSSTSSAAARAATGNYDYGGDGTGEGGHHHEDGADHDGNLEGSLDLTTGVSSSYPEGFFYGEDSAELSRAQRVFELPPEYLQLHKSLGMEWERRYNIHYLDVGVLLFAAGHTVQILDMATQRCTYVLGRNQSTNAGIGSIAVHPSKQVFAVAEKGSHPNIYIYSYPALQVLRVLRNGADSSYSSITFSATGESLASVAGAPDYMLALWDWMNERVVLKTKAFSQEIFRVTFSPYSGGRLTTSGQGHIRFWKMAKTFTGLKLQGAIGKFGSVELSDVAAYVDLPDDKVISGTDRGTLILWDGCFIQLLLARPDGRPCHEGAIEFVGLEGRDVVTAGDDGYVRRWNMDVFEFAEPGDDLHFTMEPSHEIYLGKGFQVAAMLRGDDHWIVQNKKGGLYKLSTLNDALEPVYEVGAGRFTGIEPSRRTHTAVTTSTDGSIRLWDVLAGRLLYSKTFNSSVTSLQWAPSSVTDEGKMFLAGCEDGVVRVVERTASGFALISTFKPHDCAVVSISFSSDGGQVATAGADGSIFFMHIASQGTVYSPIGFVRHNPPIVSLQWSPDAQHVLFASGPHAYQVARPVPSAYPAESARDTFRISLPTVKYAPQIKVLRRVMEEDDDEVPDLHSTNAGGDSGSSASSSSSAGGPVEEMVVDERVDSISCLMYAKQRIGSSSTSSSSSSAASVLAGMGGHFPFYVSYNNTSAGKDRGGTGSAGSVLSSTGLVHPTLKYETVYECTMSQEEPLRSIHLGSDFGVVSVMNHSQREELLLFGSKTGSVQVRPRSESQFFFFSHLHDGNTGAITGVCTTADDKLLLSVGADGNFFVSLVDVQAGLNNVDRSHTVATATSPLALELERAKQLAFAEARAIRQRELAAAKEAAANGDPSALERYMAAMAIPLPEPMDVIEDDRVISQEAKDITERTAYSIEQAKQQKELDERREAAEKKKAFVREEIRQLCAEFTFLLAKNQSLDPAHRLPRSAFELDPRLRQQLEREAAEKVKEVQEEMAWETEKNEVALRKLRNHYLAPLDVEFIELKSFRSGLMLHSFRTPSLPPFLQEAMKVIHDTPAMTMSEADAKRKQNDMDSQYASFTLLKGVNLDGEDEKTTSKRDNSRKDGGLSSTHGPGSSTGPGGVGKAGWDSAQRAAERERRKREQEAHALLRPDKDADDPQDLKVVDYARKHMGDYKLKSDPHYRVPESQRVTAETKKRQMVLLQYSVHTVKTEFNVRFLSMRALKAKLVAQLRVDGMRVAELNQALGISEPVFMPELDPSEWPERRELYTQADLDAFKAYQEAERKIAMSSGGDAAQNLYGDMDDGTSTATAAAGGSGSGANAGGGGGGGGAGAAGTKKGVGANAGAGGSSGGVGNSSGSNSGPGSTSTSTSSSLSSSAFGMGGLGSPADSNRPDALTGVSGNNSSLSFAAAAERALLLQERRDLHAERLAMVPKSEMELAEERLYRRFLEDERAELLARIEYSISVFDDGLARLRLEKIKLESDIKTTSLKLLTLYEELNLLRSFEDDENQINNKINKLKAQKAQVSLDLFQCRDQLEKKMHEIKIRAENDNHIEAEFNQLIHSDTADKQGQAAILMKIFNRKGRRSKKRGDSGTSRGDGDNGESDDDDDDDDYDGSDSDSDESDNDDDGCPPGVDPAAYELVMELRDSRIQQEEQMEEFNKQAAELRKTYERLTAKEKIVDRDYEAAQTELEIFQSEKQKALNQIEVVVPLKLSQIYSLVDNRLPSDLSQSLVFTSTGLMKLRQRHQQLLKDRDKHNADLRALKKMHGTLGKAIAAKREEIQKEKQHFEDIQILKFGEVIDLDILAKVGDDPATASLKDQLKTLEARSVRRLSKWDERVAAAKDELAQVTMQNTRWLERVAKLTEAQYQLESQLNKSTMSVHVTDSSPVDEQASAERRELLHLVQLQEKELESLKSEVHRLRTKGGRVYVPQ